MLLKKFEKSFPMTPEKNKIKKCPSPPKKTRPFLKKKMCPSAPKKSRPIKQVQFKQVKQIPKHKRYAPKLSPIYE